MPPSTQARSCVLTGEENERCRKMMSFPNSSALAIGVVQLFLTEAPRHNKWNKRTTGVVGFIKDWTRRSFFIRVFDIEKGKQVWEQELFDEMANPTFKPDMQFCLFEADDCIAGLLFANDVDCLNFKEVFETKLNKRRSGIIDATPDALLPKNNCSGAQKTEVAKANEKSALPQKANRQEAKKNMETSPSKPAELAKKPVFEVCARPQTTKSDEAGEIDFNDPAVKQFISALGFGANKNMTKEHQKFIEDFLQEKGGIKAAREQYRNAPGDNPKASSSLPKKLGPPDKAISSTKAVLREKKT